MSIKTGTEETDPQSRRQVKRVKRNTYRPVTQLCCRRPTELVEDHVD